MSTQSLPTGRSHQTAVVVDVRSGVSSNFQERYNRFLGSLNGKNIKADIFTLRANSGSSGPALVAGAPDSVSAPSTPAADIDLEAWAKSLGFTQLVLVVGLK